MNARTLLTAICIAAAGSAFAGGGGMSKDAYKAMKDRIEAKQDTELQACDKSQGNAKDICRAAAKGRARVALADLKAEYQPSPEADRGKMMALADAEYDVAKQKCDDAKGPAKDACKAKADHVHEAAVRRAKIERVEASRRLQKSAHAAAPVQATQEEKFASEKARCGLLGEERDSCMADLKKRFNRG
ncbi:hypothetical protein LZ009_02785 [Ramlibacter sp. XY19]|uniref:hypothetical protein n=1 Tax=Ramlibacter paludis TaxID=2908000 RepID=UPI0023DADD57|nr:hypothetical protein [Ramlibacter paludis]MCG2591698.1 hypothetical protein [Ramlibacter paludis]